MQVTKKYQGLVEMTFAERDSACYKPQLMASCKTYFSLHPVQVHVNSH